MCLPLLMPTMLQCMRALVSRHFISCSDAIPNWAIDAFLGIRSSEERKSHQDYVDKLKDRLADGYGKEKERGPTGTRIQGLSLTVRAL